MATTFCLVFFLVLFVLFTKGFSGLFAFIYKTFIHKRLLRISQDSQKVSQRWGYFRWGISESFTNFKTIQTKKIVILHKVSAPRTRLFAMALQSSNQLPLPQCLPYHFCCNKCHRANASRSHAHCIGSAFIGILDIILNTYSRDCGRQYDEAPDKGDDADTRWQQPKHKEYIKMLFFMLDNVPALHERRHLSV